VGISHPNVILSFLRVLNANRLEDIPQGAFVNMLQEPKDQYSLSDKIMSVLIVTKRE